MNMYGVQSTPPPAPPERNQLAQAAPGIGGIIGGIAGGIIGSIIPGAGTVVGAMIGGALGAGIGSLFKMGDDASKTSQYKDQIADYQQLRQQELQQYMQMTMMQSAGGMQQQMGIAGGMSFPGATGGQMSGMFPGATGFQVPGMNTNTPRSMY